MSGTCGRVLVVLVLAASAIAAEASARTIRETCRDGRVAHRTAGGAVLSCDVDAQCDGICSFGVPVCGTSTCRDEAFTVPVRSTRRERIAVEPGGRPTRLVLRCRPTPRSVGCVTVTTTTSGPSTTSPGHPGLTPTTIGRVQPSSSTSSSTSTSTSCSMASSTTTSIIPIPCRVDSDCDGLASACAVSFCGLDEICVRTCVCVTPDLVRTCSLDEASACLTPDDCPGPDAVCRVCYLNLCVTAPAPACSF